jgi:hypothetical protein
VRGHPSGCTPSRRNPRETCGPPSLPGDLLVTAAPRSPLGACRDTSTPRQVRPPFGRSVADVYSQRELLSRGPKLTTTSYAILGLLVIKHLARDLTLPRLRSDWPDTPQSASAAVAEWNAARRNRRQVTTGREGAIVKTCG